MPLVFSMKPGQDFYVGDDRVVVGTIYGKTRFDVVVEKTGHTHSISEEEAVEIITDVFVSSGPRPVAGIAKVAIDAPQEVLILRGDRYRESAS